MKNCFFFENFLNKISDFLKKKYFENCDFLNFLNWKMCFFEIKFFFIEKQIFFSFFFFEKKKKNSDFRIFKN